MTWDLERRDDTLIVTFYSAVAMGWGEMFEAIKVEVETGAKVVVFPKTLPAFSFDQMEVFQALMHYLIGSGVQIRGEEETQ